MKITRYLPETKDKDEFQNKVADKISEDNCIASLLYLPTGLGKTKIALNVLKNINPKNILWFVPSVKLRDDDLPAEFKKWGMSSLLNKTDILCYASSHKVEGPYDIIIYDEAHNLTERSYEDITSSNLHKRSDKQLFLTATSPPEFEKRAIISNLATREEQLGLLTKEKNIYKIEMPISDAKNRGFVSDFDIKVWNVKLNPNIKVTRKNRVYNEVTLYETLTRIYERQRARNSNTKWIALERLRFFQNLKTKENAAREIIKKIPKGKRYIVFCGSIKQANNLSNHVYHSKSGDKWLNKFINGEINDLYVIDRIDEGVNLPMLDGILVLQSNSKSRKFIQRSGRALRVRKGHKAFIWLVRCKGTRDEFWVQQSIDEIKK